MPISLLDEKVLRVIALKLAAIDVLVEKMIEPMEAIGSPESLIKKPYEQWTPEDLQNLIMVYGQGDKTPLSNTIFRKEYEKVKELEAQEIGNG